MKVPVLAASFLTLLSFPAFAGTEASKAPVTQELLIVEDDGWWFRFAPYTWITATEGDAGVAGFVAPVDISFSDTLDDLDMAFMAVAEAGYGKWSIGLDGIYGKFSDSSDLDNPLISNAKFEQRQIFLSPRVGYALLLKEDYRMDAIIGARWSYIEYDVTLRSPGGRAFQRGINEDWLDPIVGLRGRWNTTEKIDVMYYGDIGGFGAASDLTWQAYLGISMKLTSSIRSTLGYRAMGIDYQDDGFTLDTVTHGPVLGLEITF